MSVIKFELTEKHVLLLNNLRWSMKDNIIIGVGDDIDELAPPFGENNIYEAIDLILNGVPEGVDPFKMEEFLEYSDEQKAEWDKLYSELPIALSIILQRGNFELGKFKKKFHLIEWQKVG